MKNVSCEYTVDVEAVFYTKFVYGAMMAVCVPSRSTAPAGHAAPPSSGTKLVMALAQWV